MQRARRRAIRRITTKKITVDISISDRHTKEDISSQLNPPLTGLIFLNQLKNLLFIEVFAIKFESNQETLGILLLIVLYRDFKY